MLAVNQLATGFSFLALGALVLIGAAVYGVISNIRAALRRRRQ